MKPERNVPMMVVAGLLSLLLWVVVRSQDPPQSRTFIRSVKLQPNNLDTEKWIVTKIPEEIQIASEGTDADMRALNDADLVALVDLSGAKEGRSAYPVLIFPEQYRKVLSDSNLIARVEIEPLVRQQVAVTADARGELTDPNFIVTGYVVVPEKVEVQGPKSQFEQLRQLRAQVDLSQVKVNAREAYSVGLETVGRDDRPLSQLRTNPLFVRVQPILAAAPSERQVFILPRFTGKPADGFIAESFSVSPEQVTVQGRSVTVAAIRNVETEGINLTGLAETRTFTVELRLPSGVTTENRLVQVRVVVSRATPVTPEKSGP